MTQSVVANIAGGRILCVQKLVPRHLSASIMAANMRKIILKNIGSNISKML